jgi:DNA-binding NtrC family response regulator
MTTILVTDSDEDTRAVIRLILEEEHYRVVEAPDAAETVRWLRGAPERLIVLLSLRLRYGNGDLIDYLAANPDLLQRHSFIILTGSTGKLIPLNVYQLHFPILYKPFDMQELLAIVARAQAAVCQP